VSALTLPHHKVSVFPNQTSNFPDFNISPLIQYKKVSHQPDSEELFQLIHSWIDTCLQQHPHCTDTSTSDLPTRVIDVGPSDGSQMPLLYIPREALHSSSDSNKGRYVALSYCWGLEFCSGRPPLTTTSSTLPARKDGIPMDDLPQTIHDAITITRRLNIQYLWVDALCILQGQDAMDRADWAKESVKMADIYGRAFLTIAAASSRCVYDGILHARESKEENLTELFLGLQYAPYTRGRVYLGSTQSFTNSLDEPLYHHGWTLQERVLSPRVLIYKKDQLAWECQTSATTESGDDLGGVGEMRFWKSAGDALSEEGQKLGTWASELSWQGIMTDYSARALSNPSDKLIAIAGLAKAFATIHNRTSEQYLAGLWRCSLLDDLLWIHEPIALGHRHPRGRPVEDRAPSWSWAAVDGNIRWPMANKIGRGPYHVSVVSASVDASHDESFGNGSKGYITLRGPLKQLSLADIKIHRHSSWTTIGHADSVETIEMHLDASAQSNVSELEFWTAKANIEHIWFLHIKRNAFLILTQAGPGRNSALTGTSFRRLGAAISAEADWLDGFDDQTVTIV
jgi:hypothetical protein